MADMGGEVDGAVGADVIIARRCREASSSREQIWQRPRNQTATA